MIIYLLKKIKILSISCLYFFIPLNPLVAFESKDYLVINMLVNSCYKDKEACNLALSKINRYQRKSAINKKFSCQTRLLGLEANLIMVMNSNLKRNQAKIIIQTLKKYC